MNFKKIPLFVLLFVSSITYVNGQKKVDLYSKFRAEAADIIAQIETPKVSGPEINLIKYSGKNPDEEGSFDFRESIQKAIDELNGKGGGTLLFAHPLGADAWIKQTVIYRLKGPMVLKSNIEIAIDHSVKLLFDFDPSSYLPGVLTRYEGTTMFTYSPLIRALNAENIIITGREGNGAMPSRWKWGKMAKLDDGGRI